MGLTDDRLFGIYVPPLTKDELEKWLDGSEKDEVSADAVRRELRKQEFWLGLLHEKISSCHEKGVQTAHLDELAWQIQNGITGLKRKIKMFSDLTTSSIASAPITSVDHVDTRCIEIYEEKQLMATQQMLREDVAAEKKTIAGLCWKLEHSQLNSEEVEEETEEEKEEEEWKERCNLEEAARSALISEIARLRSECANLRARLEMETSSEQ
ncbi:unnamed protein product [Caenorhabditis bovis]|uniref:Uncharacterized protein n=1 Tax=Caenorhabditis bovis TaxID=2654633 RepID=A0A8S1FAX4_9PELO|nr:unnamed protein product [Caenorhabditis bovis]